MYLGKSNADGSNTIVKSLGTIAPYECAKKQ